MLGRVGFSPRQIAQILGNATQWAEVRGELVEFLEAIVLRARREAEQCDVGEDPEEIRYLIPPYFIFNTNTE